MIKKILLLLALFSTTADAARDLIGDDIKTPSSTLANTLLFPSVSDTLAGISAAQTLTNKTFSGAANTVSNISLTTAVTGILPVANGGTGGAVFPGITALTGDVTAIGGGSVPATNVSASDAFFIYNGADNTKHFKWDLSGETTGIATTLSPLATQNQVYQIQPNVDASASILTQNNTSGQVFIGANSTIGGANSGIQYSNATVANRGQIKLHSYFNGASVAGVSTLTSRSGVVGTNAAIVAGQDYSKWTAQAAATTPGSAPISGTFAFKANTVNSLTVTSDYHVALTNLAGTLGDRLYLGSEGALQLPFYTAGIAHFDGTGNITSSAVDLSGADATGILAAARAPAFSGDVSNSAGSLVSTIKSMVNRVYVDFTNGNDANTGTVFQPWKTLQHACSTITPTVNVPIAVFLSGGNNDQDAAPITCPPNIALFAEYPIQVSKNFSITGGATNDIAYIFNVEFTGTFSWVRNDATTMNLQTYNTGFFQAVDFEQDGAGAAGSIFTMVNGALDSGLTIQSGEAILANVPVLAGTINYKDSGSAFLLVTSSDIFGATIQLHGGILAEFGGDIADSGYSITGATTGSGTPEIYSDSGSIPPPASITGSFSIVPYAQAPYVAYSPAVPGNWSPTPAIVSDALDQLAARPAGGGSVTSVSVVSANGFAGTVATATTTPAITVSTTVTGLIKGNGTALSAATPVQEALTGVCDNVNTSFTISHAGITNALVVVYRDGQALVQGTDYSIAGVNITGLSCNFGQTLYASYSF